MRTFLRPSLLVVLLELFRTFCFTKATQYNSPNATTATKPATIASARMGKKNTIPKTRIASFAGVLLVVVGLN